jgi:trk/ktr system potassium uptake protein
LVGGIYPSVLHGGTPSISLSLLFEVGSALGTTGYSVGNGDLLGLSVTLTNFGKLVIIFCMFSGGFGPLLLGLGSFQEKKKDCIDFPSQKFLFASIASLPR